MAMTRRLLRSLLLCVAATATAVSPVPVYAPAFAAQSGVIDGQPTAAVCARYGYRRSGYDDDAPPARRMAPPMAMIAPSAPPPIPVPPVRKEQRIESPAPSAQAVEEVVVTGSRTVRDGSQAPTPVTVMPGSQGLAGHSARGPEPVYGAPEAYPSAKPNPVRQVASEPVSTFSIDVDTASYANTRRFLNEGRKPPASAVRVEEMLNYFDYAYPGPASRETPFKPFVAVAPSPWARGKQLIHIGVQGYRPQARDLPPLNLVFLVDTSGSMSGPDRLPLARQTLNLLIDQLRPQDRVAMVAYAGSAGAVLEPSSGRDRLRMRCALEALQSGGSTAGGAGLALAYNLAQENFNPGAVNRVILLTDGDFNVGVTDNKRLEDFIADKRKTGVYLSIYGYGRGNYQDARMQVLAQNGNGTAAYVDTLDEGRKILRDDFASAMFPIANDVKIQVEFNPAQVLDYRLVGYETRMLNREDFNNDKVDAGEVGAGASVTALYEITPRGGRGLVDPLRYGNEPEDRPAASPTGELAFLKIRYKAPGQQTSRLISRPILAGGAASIQAAPEQTRWAVAVAGDGQKMRDVPYMDDDFTWEGVLKIAQGARGHDEFGLRAEFIRLVRAAGEMRRQNAGL